MLCDCFCAERAWAVNNFIYLCLIKNKTFWHYCSIGFIYILLVIFLSSFCGPVNLKLLSLWIKVKTTTYWWLCMCLYREQQGEADVCGREEAAVQWG